MRGVYHLFFIENNPLTDNSRSANLSSWQNQTQQRRDNEQNRHQDECPDGTRSVITVYAWNDWITSAERHRQRTLRNAEAERLRLEEERHLQNLE